jgi:hypothetical protein
VILAEGEDLQIVLFFASILLLVFCKSGESSQEMILGPPDNKKEINAS